MNPTDSTLLKSQGYVDGQWLDARGGNTVAVRNPATGELLTTVPDAGAAETRQAIINEYVDTKYLCMGEV